MTGNEKEMIETVLIIVTLDRKCEVSVIFIIKRIVNFCKHGRSLGTHDNQGSWCSDITTSRWYTQWFIRFNFVRRCYVLYSALVRHPHTLRFPVLHCNLIRVSWQSVAHTRNGIGRRHDNNGEREDPVVAVI